MSGVCPVLIALVCGFRAFGWVWLWDLFLGYRFRLCLIFGFGGFVFRGCLLLYFVFCGLLLRAARLGCGRVVLICVCLLLGFALVSLVDCIGAIYICYVFVALGCLVSYVWIYYWWFAGLFALFAAFVCGCVCLLNMVIFGWFAC